MCRGNPCLGNSCGVRAAVVRRAALSHEEQHYAQRMARYPEARAEDMRRRQIELDRSTAWALARNEAAARDPLDLPYSLTPPNEEDCRYVVFSDNELFSTRLSLLF